ncbi:hypothetical protein HK405_009453, partial [Cladochytrium tenue]
EREAQADKRDIAALATTESATSMVYEINAQAKVPDVQGEPGKEHGNEDTRTDSDYDSIFDEIDMKTNNESFTKCGGDRGSKYTNDNGSGPKQAGKSKRKGRGSSGEILANVKEKVELQGECWTGT